MELKIKLFDQKEWDF